MARSHGKILVDIWIDEDWLELTPIEQWAYKMLLSQPKTNLVGCIDYEPHRWAKLAKGLTEEAVTEALVGLECAEFVCIDLETRELLVRSMTRHDGLRTNNPKILKGLWGQWKSIASRMLRKVAVDNMPAALFDGEDVPEAALDMRRSGRTDWAIGPSIERATAGEWIDQSTSQSFRPPPSAIHRPTSADARSPEQTTDRSPMPEGFAHDARTQLGA